jgi:hypothetical protein
MSVEFGAVDTYPSQISGWWWLPGRHEFRVHATLEFAGDGKAELKSVPEFSPAGWFGDPDRALAAHSSVDADAIHGITGLHQRPATMVVCQLFGSNSGNSTLSADCRAVVDGLWIRGHDHKVFSELIVEIEHLTGWAGRNTYGWGAPDPRSQHENTPVAWYRPGPVLEAHLDEARVVSIESLPTQGTDQTVSGTTIRLSHKARFRVRWESDPVDLVELWNTAIVLQDLLTFAVDGACAFTRVEALAHQDVLASITDPSFPRPNARIHVPGRVAQNPSQKYLVPEQMVFGLHDINFPDFVPRWFRQHQAFRPVLATLLGQRYLPGQYAEARLGLAVAAAEEAYRALGLDETFMTASLRDKIRKIVRRALREDTRFAPHAVRLSQQIDNRLTLEERLLHLAEQLGPVGDRLLGDRRGGWATAAKQARNLIAHTSSGGAFSGYQQAALTLATRTVIEFVLLQLLGFSNDQLLAIAEKHTAFSQLPAGLDWLPSDETDLDSQRSANSARIRSGLGWPG